MEKNSLQYHFLLCYCTFPYFRSGAALVGFQFVDPKTEGDDLRYDYYCDGSNSEVFSKIHTKTDYFEDIYGHSVVRLEKFNVDCRTISINHVLSSFEMVQKGILV